MRRGGKLDRQDRAFIEAGKAIDRAIQARAALAQQPASNLHVADRVDELDELLTVAEGAKLSKFDVTAPKSTAVAFRQWLRRHSVPVIRRGRILLIERRVLVAALRGVSHG